jgi:hypothetical protein
MDEPADPTPYPAPDVPLWRLLDAGEASSQSVPSSPAELPPPTAPPKRDKVLIVAIVAACTAFAVVTAVAMDLGLRGGGDDPNAAAASTPNMTITHTATVSTPHGTTTSAPPTSTPPSALGPPPESSLNPGAIPPGFRQVSGPGGIMVSIPGDWPVRPGATAFNMQADDPDSPGDLIRFGGSPSPPVSLLDSVVQNEADTPTIRDGYQRLRLERVSGTTDIVEWEFLFIKDGQPRHAFGRYWRLDGLDYVVYASAATNTWPGLQPVIDVVVRTATLT